MMETSGVVAENLCRTATEHMVVQRGMCGSCPLPNGNLEAGERCPFCDSGTSSLQARWTQHRGLQEMLHDFLTCEGALLREIWLKVCLRGSIAFFV